MADDLGLGELSDDQLVALARGLAVELARRGADPFAAARDAAAQARAAADKARAATAQWSDWAKAKRVALMLTETLGERWTFHAWRSPTTGERRVYLEGPIWRGGKTRGSGKITYSVDGNRRFPPGDLELLYMPADAPRDRVAAICRYIAACWDQWPQIDASRAIAVNLPLAPAPDDYH